MDKDKRLSVINVRIGQLVNRQKIQRERINNTRKQLNSFIDDYFVTSNELEALHLEKGSLQDVRSASTPEQAEKLDITTDEGPAKKRIKTTMGEDIHETLIVPTPPPKVISNDEFENINAFVRNTSEDVSRKTPNKNSFQAEPSKQENNSMAEKSRDPKGSSVAPESPSDKESSESESSEDDEFIIPTTQKGGVKLLKEIVVRGSSKIGLLYENTNQKGITKMKVYHGKNAMFREIRFGKNCYWIQAGLDKDGFVIVDVMTNVEVHHFTVRVVTVDEAIIVVPNMEKKSVKIANAALCPLQIYNDDGKIADIMQYSSRIIDLTNLPKDAVFIAQFKQKGLQAVKKTIYLNSLIHTPKDVPAAEE